MLLLDKNLKMIIVQYWFGLLAKHAYIYFSKEVSDCNEALKETISFMPSTRHIVVQYYSQSQKWIRVHVKHDLTNAP